MFSKAELMVTAANELVQAFIYEYFALHFNEMTLDDFEWLEETSQGEEDTTLEELREEVSSIDTSDPDCHPSVFARKQFEFYQEILRLAEDELLTPDLVRHAAAKSHFLD